MGGRASQGRPRKPKKIQGGGGPDCPVRLGLGMLLPSYESGVGKTLLSNRGDVKKPGYASFPEHTGFKKRRASAAVEQKNQSWGKKGEVGGDTISQKKKR